MCSDCSFIRRICKCVLFIQIWTSIMQIMEILVLLMYNRPSVYLEKIGFRSHAQVELGSLSTKLQSVTIHTFNDTNWDRLVVERIFDHTHSLLLGLLVSALLSRLLSDFFRFRFSLSSIFLFNVRMSHIYCHQYTVKYLEISLVIWKCSSYFVLLSFLSRVNTTRRVCIQEENWSERVTNWIY